MDYDQKVYAGWRPAKKRSLKMLVLSRQRDESIIIGDDIEIVIVDVRGDKVRLGINAPREVSVHRKEIYDAIQREKAQQQKEQQQKD
ncbi:hypothetical protein LCGC14_0197900 [marine sediment metagenome]|uniref:Carbon storage regulator n=1 Tax=marine sediment metagenome TaxID=412755 RepID=A0A0F9XN52_9ZZZZ